MALGSRSPASCSIGELVERHVAVEGVDHPIAPARHVAAAVDVVAVRVGIAGGVEPVEGHPLAVVRRGQQAIDQLFVGIGTRVGQKGIDLGRRRRQAGQVERQPADQRCLVRLGRRLQSLALEPGQNEAIDRISRPAGIANFRQRRPHRGDKRPMHTVNGPFRDPALEQVLLHRRKLMAAFGGGICSPGSAEKMRRTNSPSSGLPGTIATSPDSSLPTADFRSSSRKPA